jgi:hypothetical protein
MTTPLTVSREVHFRSRRHGRRELVSNARPEQPVQPGRVPRVARLMALALHFEGLIRSGAVASYADVATLGHVSRARISQIMNLLNLAPDVLEAVLFLPRVERGRDTIHLRDLQPIASTVDWAKQRRQWRELCRQQDVEA